MEALGSIDELRRTDTPRWLLDVRAEPAGVHGLVATVPGAVVLSAPRPGAHVVELTGPDPAGAAQALLAGALQLGAVQEFSPVRPSLADLFRGVVSSGDVPATGPGEDPPAVTGRRRRGRREVAA
jgi:ABC-2 type transport system ATP-binding protein